MIIKNCEETGSFICVQANKLVYYYSTIIGRRYENPGLEKKDFAVHDSQQK